MSPLAPGDRLGPYEILGASAARGLNGAYRARDTRGGAEVSIKLLPGRAAPAPDQADAYAHAMRAATLVGSGLVTVFDVGAHQGTPYVVFELLQGETLRTRLERAPLASGEAVGYALQLARGLAVAHDRGLVHADLAPDNVFLGTDGRARVLDFGLTGASAQAAPRPAAMAVDTQGDVLAWGRLARAMLGRAAPPAVRAVLDRSLEGDPARGFATARHLAVALEEAAAMEAPAPWRPSAWRWWVAALLAGMGAAVTGLLAWCRAS